MKITHDTKDPTSSLYRTERGSEGVGKLKAVDEDCRDGWACRPTVTSTLSNLSFEGAYRVFIVATNGTAAGTGATLDDEWGSTLSSILSVSKTDGTPDSTSNSSLRGTLCKTSSDSAIESDTGSGRETTSPSMRPNSNKHLPSGIQWPNPQYTSRMNSNSEVRQTLSAAGVQEAEHRNEEAFGGLDIGSVLNPYSKGQCIQVNTAPIIHTSVDMLYRGKETDVEHVTNDARISRCGQHWGA